ncbi:FapA family protein [Brevibacillus centrosporus]|uniref:FapA family protein n=1 Tax=Brevibacillus centrosporus TaxID=54910 RepID=UPI002E1EF043|nr:FapA family protein [Brevibacillus centrosporus]
MTSESYRLNPFEQSNNDGHISVINNQIYIKDAMKMGKQPFLLESDTVDVFVNGTLLKGSKVVFNSDQVEWKLREKGSFFKIWVRADQLEAYFQLLESPKSSDLKPVHAAPSAQLELDGDIKLCLRRINEEFHKQGIVAPDIVSVMHELSNSTYKPVVIARGISPQAGKDGWLETYFENATSQMLEETDGKVNFRQGRSIPSVESGTVLGEIHPPELGKHGISVFGTPIEAPSGRELAVKAGKHIEISRGKCIALRSGRPVVTGDLTKCIDIQHVYEHKGNVNLETGNIFFNGDVVIHGDVEEEMHVESFGNITVYGNVYKSTLISAQNIYVTGTIFGSQLAGGRVGLLYSKVYNILDQFLKQFALLVDSVDIVLERFVRNGDKRATYGYLADLLIKMKFPMIAKLAMQYSEVMQFAGKMVPPEVLMVDRMLGTYRKSDLLQQKSTKQELISITDYMVKLHERIKDSIYEESDAVITSANGTRIETTGNIYVIGSGTVQSELYAGNQVVYKRSDSSCRGGRLVAGKEIEVREVISGHRIYLEAGEKIAVHSGSELRLVMNGAAMDVYDECREVIFIKVNGRISQIPMPKRNG